MYRSGQIIKASVNLLPGVYHYGIIINENKDVYVLHNTPFRSAVKDTLSDFLKSRKLTSLLDSDLIYCTNDGIEDRFKAQCSKSYDLFNYNCEHFIDCMLDREEKSEQLLFFTAVIVAGIILS